MKDKFVEYVNYLMYKSINIENLETVETVNNIRIVDVKKEHKRLIINYGEHYVDYSIAVSFTVNNYDTIGYIYITFFGKKDFLISNKEWYYKRSTSNGAKYRFLENLLSEVVHKFIFNVKVARPYRIKKMLDV